MVAAPNPLDILGRVRRDVERNATRARNAIRLARSDRPTLGATQYDVVWAHGRAQLWHYRSGRVTVAPPVLIVFSLFSRSYILDLAPGNSFVEHLLAAGHDVYLLDWGVADQRDADNHFEDYVDGYLPAAVARVLATSGADELNLVGYCVGGVLTLLYAAHHADAPIRSLTVLATPVDFTRSGPLSDALGPDGLAVEEVLDGDGNVPANAIRRAFRSLTPTAEVSRYVNLWDRLWDDEYLVAYQGMTGWADDHVPLPGALARQLAHSLVGENALLTDRMTLGGEPVHLADITVPFLTVRATRDHIVTEAAAAPLLALVGSPDKRELCLPAGHVGLLVGKTAARTTIPSIIEFLQSRSTSLPDGSLAEVSWK